MGNHVDCAIVQHGIASWTCKKGRDDWGTSWWDQCPSSTRNELSWVSLASEKNEIPIVQAEAAARQRHWAKQHHGYIGRESLCVMPFGLYPASRVLGRCPAGLESKLLLQASWESWSEDPAYLLRRGKHAATALVYFLSHCLNFSVWTSSSVPENVCMSSSCNFCCRIFCWHLILARLG
jgi:hypothetical protein